MAAQLVWSAASSQHLRDFLAKCPEFKAELARIVPRSGVLQTLESAACAGQYTEGYLHALDKMDALASPPDAPRHGLNIDVTRGDARGI